MQLIAPVNYGDELRRFKIPSGFTLIIDSREQHPLYKPNEIEGLEVITHGVVQGATSIAKQMIAYTVAYLEEVKASAQQTAGAPETDDIRLPRESKA